MKIFEIKEQSQIKKVKAIILKYFDNVSASKFRYNDSNYFIKFSNNNKRDIKGEIYLKRHIYIDINYVHSDDLLTLFELVSNLPKSIHFSYLGTSKETFIKSIEILKKLLKEDPEDIIKQYINPYFPKVRLKGTPSLNVKNKWIYWEASAEVIDNIAYNYSHGQLRQTITLQMPTTPSKKLIKYYNMIANMPDHFYFKAAWGGDMPRKNKEATLEQLHKDILSILPQLAYKQMTKTYGKHGIAKLTRQDKKALANSFFMKILDELD